MSRRDYDTLREYEMDQIEADDMKQRRDAEIHAPPMTDTTAPGGGMPVDLRVMTVCADCRFKPEGFFCLMCLGLKKVQSPPLAEGEVERLRALLAPQPAPERGEASAAELRAAFEAGADMMDHGALNESVKELARRSALRRYPDPQLLPGGDDGN